MNESEIEEQNLEREAEIESGSVSDEASIDFLKDQKERLAHDLDIAQNLIQVLQVSVINDGMSIKETSEALLNKISFVCSKNKKYPGHLTALTKSIRDLLSDHHPLNDWKPETESDNEAE